MENPLIRLEKLSKSFGDKVILDQVDLDIRQGEIFTVIGKSGVGKSVLLKHIIGLLKPDSGRVLFEGRDLFKMKKKERRALKTRISYVFQNMALFDSMTVFENVSLPLREKNKMGQEEIDQAVALRMDQLDLGGIAEKFPSQLSGGMQKRVALARALVTDPEIVLFDEPTTGLDPVRKSAVHSMIAEYQKKFGFTGIVVSHEIPDVFFISQKVAMIDQGRIRIQGTPDQVQQSDDPVVRQFLLGLESPRDDLTGMDTQTQFQRRYAEEMDRVRHAESGFALVVFTVENLDEINDKMGHVRSQTILKNFAEKLHSHLRLTDTCSRYGLDKILAVLPNTDMKQARQVCSSLGRKMRARDITDIKPYPGFCFSVNAGFSEASYGSTIEDVLREAEKPENTVYAFNIC